MIIVENITFYGREFTKKYSNENRYLVDESGAEYEEAIDLIDYPKEYTEGREIEIEEIIV